MLPSLYGRELGLRGSAFRGHICIHFRCGPMTCSPSLKMALSIGFRDSISLLSTIQATRSLTLPLVGLSPTEHTSFSWTHFRKAGFPRYGFKAGISDGA